MELNKLYELNEKKSKLNSFFLGVILLLMILFSSLGFTFVSFLLSILFFFRVYRTILRSKKMISFFRIEKSELNGDNKINFFDSRQKLIIQDVFVNFTFYEKKNKIFEIRHKKLKKNIFLPLEGNTTMIYNFIIEKKMEIKKSIEKPSFWEIVELIFMP